MYMLCMQQHKNMASKCQKCQIKLRATKCTSINMHSGHEEDIMMSAGYISWFDLTIFYFRYLGLNGD